VLARYLRLPRLLPPFEEARDRRELIAKSVCIAVAGRDEETGFQIDEERCAALLTPVPRFTCRIGLPRASIWREVSVPMQLSMDAGIISDTASLLRGSSSRAK